MTLEELAEILDAGWRAANAAPLAPLTPALHAMAVKAREIAARPRPGTDAREDT